MRGFRFVTLAALSGRVRLTASLTADVIAPPRAVLASNVIPPPPPPPENGVLVAQLERLRATLPTEVVRKAVDSPSDFVSLCDDLSNVLRNASQSPSVLNVLPTQHISQFIRELAQFSSPLTANGALPPMTAPESVVCTNALAALLCFKWPEAFLVEGQLLGEALQARIEAELRQRSAQCGAAAGSSAEGQHPGATSKTGGSGIRLPKHELRALVDRIAAAVAAVSRHVPREKYVRSDAVSFIAEKANFLSNDGVSELSRICKAIASLTNNRPFWVRITPRVLRALSDAEAIYKRQRSMTKRRVPDQLDDDFDDVENGRAERGTEARLDPAEVEPRRTKIAPLKVDGTTNFIGAGQVQLEYAVIFRLVAAFHKGLYFATEEAQLVVGNGSRVLIDEACHRVASWPDWTRGRVSAYSAQLQSLCRHSFHLNSENIAALLKLNLDFPTFPIELSPLFVEHFVQPFIHTARRGDIALLMAVVTQSKLTSEHALNACLARSIRLQAEPETLLLMVAAVRELSRNIHACYSAKNLGRFLKEFIAALDTHFSFLLPQQLLTVAEAVPRIVNQFGPSVPLSQKLIAIFNRVAESFATRFDDHLLDAGSAERLLTAGRRLSSQLNSQRGAPSLQFSPGLVRLDATMKERRAQATSQSATTSSTELADAEAYGPASMHVKEDVRRLWQALEEVNQSLFLFDHKKISPSVRYDIYKLIDRLNIFNVLCALHMMQREASAAIRSSSGGASAPRTQPVIAQDFSAVNDRLIAAAAEARAREDAAAATHSDHPRFHVTEELQNTVARCIEDRLRKLRRSPEKRQALLLGTGPHSNISRLAVMVDMIRKSPMKRLRFSPMFLEELLLLAEEMKAPAEIDALTAMLIECGSGAKSARL